MIDASNFVKVMKVRRGQKTGRPEEIACWLGYFTDNELPLRGYQLATSGYRDYLVCLLDAREL
jgi:hypothetical protein